MNRNATLAAVRDHQVAGRLDESERLLRQLMVLDPNDSQVKLLLGIIVATAGRHAEASPVLREVLAENPSSFEALFWLSIIVRNEKRLPEAIDLARQAVDLQLQSPSALNNLGICQMEAHDLEGAAVSFAKSAKLRPSDPTAQFNLGTCLGLLGRDAEAVEALRKASALVPDSVDIRTSIAKTLLNLNEIEAAIREAHEALRISPDSPGVHRFLGLALMHQGKSDAAREHIERALALEPEDGPSYATLGSILQSSGRIPDSNASFRHSISLEPKQGHAYFGLIHNQRLTEGDRELLVRMEALVSEGALAPKDLLSLEYGLGKGYEDLKEYEKAMANYDAANRRARKLKFGDTLYDTAQAAASTDLKIRRYTREFFTAACPKGLPDPIPIFIVGMMRSGTTLLEQILSNHPSVEAGGELEFWPNHALECIGFNGRPDLIKLRSLGGRYLKLLAKIAPNAAHVTDKMPSNYFYLGLIHAAFPNARIVHIRRNPADTAISIYATPNRARIDFAHNKATIVAAYKEYVRLMDHWKCVLPSDRLMEVRYEELIENGESVTRDLAAFCGLPWSDSMLRPESNERSVVTPSVWQVRQPIYRSSMERWKRFEPYLGAFRNLLELTGSQS